VLIGLVKRVVLAVIVTGALALLLVVTQRPAQMSGAGALDPTGQTGSLRTDGAAQLHAIPMRDGYPLRVRTYGGADDVPLLVLVHGAGSDGEKFDSLASALADKADVIVPDLRGHGTAPGRRGDVDYIGQLEDDLADMIAAVVRPGQTVILGGHGWGGGLVVRFAGGAQGDLMDGAVLLAPFLAHSAPTTRQDPGGQTTVLARRLFGLSILNTFGITALNHLPVVQIAMPRTLLGGPSGDTATLTYSYRLHASFAPRRDYLRDVAALPTFVLLAGGADAFFISSRYAPTMGAVTDRGRYDMILGATHPGLVDDPRTRAIIAEFLDGY
jgi:alpha-beta hydrolase superfamily lysophospholipase